MGFVSIVGFFLRFVRILCYWSRVASASYLSLYASLASDVRTGRTSSTSNHKALLTLLVPLFLAVEVTIQLSTNLDSVWQTPGLINDRRIPRQIEITNLRWLNYHMGISRLPRRV